MWDLLIMTEFGTQEEDFEEITAFLAEYKWLFDFKLTRIFVDDVLDNIPWEWKETLTNLSKTELAGLPFGRIKMEWPYSLTKFIQNCVKFSLPREINWPDQGFQIISPLRVSDIDPEIKRGMTGKKIHEVCHMTSLIDHVTRKKGNDGVIDVGSGLGYLGQVLHCNYGHNVLGVEGKQGHTTGADSRTHKFERCHQLHNVTCELSEQKQSQQEFLSLILDWFSEKKSVSKTCCHFSAGSKTVKSHDKTLHTGSSTNKSYDKYLQSGSCEKQSDKTGFEISEKVANNFEKQIGTKDFSMTGSQSVFGNNQTGNNENCDNGFQVAVQNSYKEVKNCDLMLKERKILRENKVVCDSEGVCCSSDKMEDCDKTDIVPTFSMVGLHCCGDLTPIMLNNFVELDQITSLCCISCCYHRMKFNEDAQVHDNFPMSLQLKRSMVKTQQRYPDFKFSPYSLRLAAQETRARWREQTDEEHDFHMRNVAYRGILETCLLQKDMDDEAFQFKKNVRKLAHKGDYQSFTKYIDAVFKHIYSPDTVSSEDFKQKFLERMLQKFDIYQNYLCLIEPVTALQYLLQPVLESLIYLDRKQWLSEHGLQAEIVPIFDELISPRNLALVAWK